MIFVTGGTGLTGSRLLYDLAAQGHRVTALKRASSSLDIFNHYFSNQPQLLKNIEWCEGDITDLASLDVIAKGADVYHCAGVVSFDPADRELLYNVNIKG